MIFHKPHSFQWNVVGRWIEYISILGRTDLECILHLAGNKSVDVCHTH